MARPLRVTTVGILCAAGAAGASASVFGKLASQQQAWPAKALCYALLLACNLAMMALYTRGLRAVSSLQATVTAVAANIFCSGQLGRLLFGERLSLQWHAADSDGSAGAAHAGWGPRAVRWRCLANRPSSSAAAGTGGSGSGELSGRGELSSTQRAPPSPEIAQLEQEQLQPPDCQQLFNYKVVLAYDGTRYQGWQLQSVGTPTIQGCLEGALGKFTKEPREVLRVQAAGRTDAGVHARGQVAQFLTRTPVDPDTALRALNSMLPPDIVASVVQRVPIDFNVRYSLRKTYHYTIHTQPLPDPFTARYRAHPRHADRLDVEAVRSAAQLFVGTHCFAAFSNVLRDGRKKNPIKTIHRFDVEPVEGGVRLAVEGSGFLYKQVRHMAGALLAVGFGRLDPQRIQQLLALSPEESPAGRQGYRGWNVADAKGLCLHAVEYPPHDNPEQLMFGEGGGLALESDQD